MKKTLTALCLLVAIPSTASAVVLLPYQHFTTNNLADHAVLNVGAGQISAAISHMMPLTTSLVPPTTASYSLHGSGDAFDLNSGRSGFTLVPWPPTVWTYRPVPVALIAETLSDTTSGVTLYVGR